MGVRDYIFGNAESGETPLRVRDLERYDPGNTIPPINREQKSADIHHLKSFEAIAKTLKDTNDALDNNRDSMIELDRLAAQERHRLDDEREQLQFTKNTLLDQLQQYVETTVPNGKLIIEPTVPPDPSTLDVSFEQPLPTTPPSIPTQEDE